MRLSSDQKQAVGSAVTTMQFIGGALIMGVLSFGVGIGSLGDAEAEPTGFVSPASAVAAVLAALAAIFVPKLIASQSIQARLRVDPNILSEDNPEGELAPVRFLSGVYQTSFIIGVAILEGAAFFNVVIYLTEQQVYTLVAAGALVVGIALMIPTRGRVERWMEDQLRTRRDSFE